MPALATPVLDAKVTAGLGYTVRISTSLGHEVAGLLVRHGRQIVTTTLARDALRVWPAFPHVSPAHGEWPAAAQHRDVPAYAAVVALDLAAERPACGTPKCRRPVKRARGLAPVPQPDGSAHWARVAVLGPVPRESNRTSDPIYLATMSNSGPQPAPGTPVFRYEDGACIGLLVPSSAITTPLSAPLCAMAAIPEVLAEGV